MFDFKTKTMMQRESITPQEMANDLVEKFNFIYVYDCANQIDIVETIKQRKQCALIAVDEIHEEVKLATSERVRIAIDVYWKSVKKEIYWI